MTDFLGFFGHTAVINLPERKDRRRSVEKQFDELGWLNYSFMRARKFDDASGFSKPSWRGCFYSHLDCIRLAKERDFKSILIFEDDIYISPAMAWLSRIVLHELDALKGNWDMIYFGHELPGFQKADSSTNKVILEPCPAEFDCAHFYAVNQRIYDRLIAHFERNASTIPHDGMYGPMLPDGAYNTFRRYNKDVITYVSNPKLGWQRPSRSDISPRWADAFTILRPIASVARELKHRLTR